MDFLGGLGKKFSHAARTVTERTKDSVENTKLAVDLRSARSDLESRYAELGRAYYNSLTMENYEVPASLIQRVREGVALVESLAAQRDRALRQVRCAACGSAQPQEANFCSNCGRPMPESAPVLEESAPDDAEYCEFCGAMRQGTSNFCAVCGEAFSREDMNPPAVIQPAKEPAPDPLEEPEDTEAE